MQVLKHIYNRLLKINLIRLDDSRNQTNVLFPLARMGDCDIIFLLHCNNKGLWICQKR